LQACPTELPDAKKLCLQHAFMGLRCVFMACTMRSWACRMWLCPVCSGVIIVALGTRYQNYCANVSRTYIINPTKVQEGQYAALLKAHEAAIGALKEGAPAKAAMEAATKVGANSSRTVLLIEGTWGLGARSDLVAPILPHVCT